MRPQKESSERRYRGIAELHMRKKIGRLRFDEVTREDCEIVMAGVPTDGWTTWATLNKYRRAARTWAELDLGTWKPLHEAIPELADPATLASDYPTNTQGPLAEWQTQRA